MSVVTRFNGLAPEYEGRPSGPILPALTSLFGANGDAIRLRTNEVQTGYRLIGADGLGAADMQNTIEPSAQGGGSIRHRRYSEGTVYLLVKVAGASTGELQDMVSRLVSLVTEGATVISVWDPVSQEYRSKEVFYESGLGAPEWKSPLSEAYGITFAYVEPFWRGPERVVTERIAPPVKPLITADPGSPVNRWDDPEFADTTAYEPWFVVDGGLEKQGTGAEHGRFVAGHRISVNPGETVSVSAGLSYVDGPNVGDIQVRIRAYDDTATLVAGSEQTVISEAYAVVYTGTYVVPATGVEIELGFYTASDVHANTRARIDSLDVKRDVQYLARYEWEGEPHASPSIKRNHTGQVVAWNPLSGVDREFDKIWVQEAPPPSGTSYEWAGERHASESIKKVDGEEVARNYYPNPSFEIRSVLSYGTEQTQEHSSEMSKLGQYSTKVTATGATSTLWLYEYIRLDLPLGRYIVKVWVYMPSFIEGRITDLRMQNGVVPSVLDYFYDLKFDEWFEATFEFERTENHTSHHQFWIGARFTPSVSDPGDYVYFDQASITIDGSYFDGDTVSDRAHDLWYDADGVPHGWVNGSGWVVLDDPGFWPVPEGFMSLPVEAGFDGDSPDEVDEGSREGAYSFPFFPVFLADSTVQGEHELRVEGDAPVWPIWEIVGPGRDVEIIGPDGSRLFVEGEVSSPITIVTEPGKRSIRDASGLIWERMKPGDDQFFALEPGEQTVKMTMVGGNPESTIKAVYSENWKTPRGTAQGMIRGGAV